MRTGGGLVAIALAVGCFNELPAPPAGTEGETSEATGAAGTTAAGEGTTGGAGMTVAPEDQDPGTGAPTSGGGEPAAQGLFACEVSAMCQPWDCSNGCPVLDPVAKCVLTALRDRVSAMLTMTHCDGQCLEYRVLPRGGGADEVQLQWRMVDAPDSDSEVKQCTLKPPKHFEGCLTSFTAECADPKTWADGCEAAEPACK